VESRFGGTVRRSHIKHDFVQGDTASLTITSSQDAYIHIFNLWADDTLEYYHASKQGPLVMPIQVQANERLTFPPPGVSLTMDVLAGFQTGMEAFIVVATKEKIPLPLLLNQKTRLSLPELNTALLKIEGDVVEEFVIYQVKRRQS